MGVPEHAIVTTPEQGTTASGAVDTAPVLNRGGYIPDPGGAGTVLVDLSHCKVLTDWDPDHPMVALAAALADKDTEWLIPRALVEACGSTPLAQLNAATSRETR